MKMTAKLQRVHDRCVEEGKCWIWQGATAGTDERPCVNWDGKTQYVRRIVRQESDRYCRKLSDGLVVTATCGNKKCVSPDCVVLVTLKQAREIAASFGAYVNPLKIRKATATRRAASPYTEEIVAQVLAAKNAKEAHRTLGISHSYAKAIRRGVSRAPLVSHWAGL